MKIVHIGIHGQSVPPWLCHVTKLHKDSVLGEFVWCGFPVVTVEGGEFYIRPLFPTKRFAKLNGAKGVNLEFQSPAGGFGHMNWLGPQSAVFPGWFLSAIAGILVGAALCTMWGF